LNFTAGSRVRRIFAARCGILPNSGDMKLPD